MLGLWSVLALSGTLAGEAAKGSLDLLASTPHEPALDRARRSSPGTSPRVVVAMVILGRRDLRSSGQAFARPAGRRDPARRGVRPGRACTGC